MTTLYVCCMQCVYSMSPYNIRTVHHAFIFTESLSDMEDDSEAEAEAEKAQKEARAAAAMAKLEAAFAVDDNEESDVEDVTAADNPENDDEIPEILVGADGANPIKKAGSNKDGRQILECNYDDDCEFKTTNLGKMTNHIASMHLQSKDHECPHCEFATATKEQLKKHITRKHFSEGRRYVLIRIELLFHTVSF